MKINDLIGKLVELRDEYGYDIDVGYAEADGHNLITEIESVPWPNDTLDLIILS